ncbi:MAG: plasmid recombination protein [Oscillospiraceae bacterium]|nr:plasmid recombination protein [Oscillospiraceae bacterium]MBR3419282.1 plasmid recombination protein [Oscillospiraceae bacterium]
MEKFSISFTLGKAASQHGANIRHNNRKFTAANVDEKRIADNIIYVQQDVRDAYHQLFDRALQEYNAKQTRRDRVIPDYYLHMAESKREEAFYEIVVQFGDCETSPCGSERGDLAKQMLQSYMRDFQRRNPNLFVFNAVLHLDEASPHLHIDFIPFYTKGRKNGLQKGVSMKAALIEQGFRPRSPKENQLVMWEFAERAEMERVLRVHGCERDDKDVHRKHLPVDEFKLQRETAKLIRRAAELRHANVSADQMQRELAESRKKIAELEAAQQSPFKAFYYSSPDKQAWVQQQLDERGIPYRETENGFEAQECYVQTIRRIEQNFKIPHTSARDRLRDMIDRMLMQSRSFDEMLDRLTKAGYIVKHGKYIAVQPPRYGSFIRLKSLGEYYSEAALRNRLAAKMDYEQNLVRDMEQAKLTNAPNRKVLEMMHFYIISFSKGYLPVRKKNPQGILTWKNDAELDRLLALNEKINEGATLDSLRADMAEKEAAVRSMERTRDGCDHSDSETIMRLNAALVQAEQEFREAADFLTIAEQVLGGTFLQEIGDAERRRLESDYISNGTKPGGNKR